MFKSNFSNIVWDINTKFWLVVNLYGTWCQKPISCHNHLKLQMGMAGLIFEPHSSILVLIHFFLSCKITDFFMTLQVVLDLEKLSVSV